jgi:hypothetical protein
MNPAGFQSGSNVDAGNTYSSPVQMQAPHEALEKPDWLFTPDVIAMNTSFRREISNGIGITQSPSATEFVSPSNVQPPPASSSSLTFQSLSIEDVGPPGYAPQLRFGPLPAAEMGENMSYKNSPYVAPAHFPK